MLSAEQLVDRQMRIMIKIRRQTRIRREPEPEGPHDPRHCQALCAARDGETCAVNQHNEAVSESILPKTQATRACLGTSGNQGSISWQGCGIFIQVLI